MSRPTFAFVTKLFLIACTVSKAALNAAEGDCQTGPGQAVFVAALRVMTENRTPIEGLSFSNFRLTLGKTPQPVCSLGHFRQPLSMGILLDATGSMAYGKRDLLAIAKAGINTLLETSGPQDQYFLELVNDAPDKQYAFTSNLGTLRAKLDVKARGRTALIDAVSQALTAMRKARHRNRALLIISDGYDNLSAHRMKELNARLSDALLPVFLIIPIDRRANGPHLLEEEYIRDALVRFADRSGGYATVVFTKEEIMAAVSNVGAAARSPYMVYFAVPEPLMANPIDLRIQVVGIRARPTICYRGAFLVSSGLRALSTITLRGSSPPSGADLIHCGAGFPPAADCPFLSHRPLGSNACHRKNQLPHQPRNLAEPTAPGPCRANRPKKVY